MSGAGHGGFPRLPRALVFDMDGLMLDTEPLAARAWSEAAESLGMAFDMACAPRLVGRNLRDCRALIVAHHGDGYAVDAVMSRWHEAYDAICEREGVALKPGLVELLDWLEARGIDKAVATSTRRARAHDKLERVGIARRFSALVGGDEVEHGKPAPDIFLMAARRIACEPVDCLVLEDSMPGFRGAVRAGMAVIVVPDLGPPDPEPGDAVPTLMRSLHEVRAHLAARGE